MCEIDKNISLANKKQINMKYIIDKPYKLLTLVYFKPAIISSLVVGTENIPKLYS